MKHSSSVKGSEYRGLEKRSTLPSVNKLSTEDRPVHDWYRFVLSFPPHLVRDYLERFGVHEGQLVLDPFCGTGTTLVECKKLGIPSIGVEANPLAHFVSQTKVDWAADPDGLLEHAKDIFKKASSELRCAGIMDEFSPSLGNSINHLPDLLTLSEERYKLLLTNSISPLPLHKTLVLLDCLKRNTAEKYRRHELLALAKALVFSISNLRFGPEVGLGKVKEDAAVLTPWLDGVQTMANDLRASAKNKDTKALVIHADSRKLLNVLKPNSVDAVITSPPYPNEKDYTRTTRLESVLLEFISNRQDLRTLKKGLIRSNTRNVYVGDDDGQWVTAYPEIQRISQEIEDKRVELAKTSGFEKLYGTVTRLYFGGMARHLAELRGALRPGAHLAYVVGDQASYFRVMIKTGELTADIAHSLGYEVESIDLFRTRAATATKVQLREEIIVLRWPGK